MSRVAVAILCAALATGPASAEPKVVPLFEGEIGTFDGFHVPEGRMDELKRAEDDAKELSLRLGSEKERCRKKLKVYVVKLKEATAPPPFYKTPTFNFLTGLVAGLVVAGTAFKAASALSR